MSEKGKGKERVERRGEERRRVVKRKGREGKGRGGKGRQGERQLVPKSAYCVQLQEKRHHLVTVSKGVVL